MADPVERLKALVQEQGAAFLIGAGVSIQVTGDAPAARWRGFMAAGVALAAERTADRPDTSTWQAWILGELDSQDPDARLRAEDEVLLRLGGMGSDDVARWLRESVGALPVVNPEPVKALAALGVPLMTLNYDDLLSDITGWPPVTWKEPERMRRVMLGKEQGIIHLHGHWSRPDSIVLGTTGYAAIEFEREAQALVQSISFEKTLVLVGFGAPLDTPQFQPLRSWLTRSRFARGMRLVAASEKPYFTAAQFPVEARHLDVVVYGGSYAELTEFLKSIAPAPEADSTRLRHLVRVLGTFVGAAGFALTVYAAVQITGVLSLLSAIGFGVAAVLADETFFRGRPRVAKYAGLAVLLVVAGVLLVAAATGDSGSAQTTTAQTPSTTTPTTPTTTGTTTKSTDQANVPITRTRTTLWTGMPTTGRVLDLTVTIGKLDLADDDDEDVAGRMLLRVGEQRCPERDYWRNVRSGDRLELTTRNHHYVVLVQDVRFASSLTTMTTRTTLRTPSAGGCRRS